MNVKGWIPSLVTVVRTVSLCIFLYNTFSITVSSVSVASLLVLLISIYGVDNPNNKSKPKLVEKRNPLKGKPKISSLSQSREDEVGLTIGQFVTNYDPENCTALENFDPVKQGSECIFARKARLWGSQNWDSAASLEENVCRSAPMFYKFTLVCQELGLDGFLVELPGQQYGSDPQVFGKAVRLVLQKLSDMDPAAIRCMDKSYIDKPGWVFEFNRVTFFVTTFAPFYPSSNSRYAHGAPNCFILLQPEISFAQHDLCDDTTQTNWDDPQTVRDTIRLAFRNAGRKYLIGDTLMVPMVHDIVKPIREGVDPLVEWWLK